MLGYLEVTVLIFGYVVSYGPFPSFLIVFSPFENVSYPPLRKFFKAGKGKMDKKDISM